MPRGRRKAPVTSVSEPTRQDPADGVAALAEMAGPVSEPRDLGNFAPEGGPGNQGPAKRQREPRQLPTVDDELAERRARGEQIRPVKPGRGEAVDDGIAPDDGEEPDSRAALTPERDPYEAPDPGAIFGDAEGGEPEEGGEPTAHSLDEYEQRFLQQDNEIQTLRSQLEQVARGGQPAQPAQAPGQLTQEQVAEIVRYDRLLPFSFNDATAEQMGISPQGVQLLDAALRHTVQHTMRMGAQLFGSEIARLEARLAEFEPVRRTVDAQTVQSAFYTAHRDLAGYEQEASNIWDQYARAYPQASPEQMIRSVGAATRKYVRERGIRPRQVQASPQQAAPARTSGMLGQPPLPSRRVRPATADGGGAAGGRVNGSGRPLTAVQAQLAQMAGLNLH